MIWKSSAPSNIAIIKYMGKDESGKNQATNSSLSMTLSAFTTKVEIEKIESSQDRWRPLPDCSPLREESTKKFMDFFARIKKENGIAHAFEVRSGNNFPSDAGLASSASSFAALTQTAFLAFSQLNNTKMPSPLHLAQISRTGSGSSCRSFFSPWCAWEGDNVYEVKSNLDLVDLVVVFDEGFKKVSSSEAHKKVKTSPLFTGRIERAQSRMKEATLALAEGDFKKLAEISWAELWDMHSLFHTSNPPFFYFAPSTIEILRWVENNWEKTGNGPIATIDAGPNVHLLVRAEEVAQTKSALKKFKILESRA